MQGTADSERRFHGYSGTTSGIGKGVCLLPGVVFPYKRVWGTVKTDAKGMFYMKRNDKEFVNSITGGNIQKGCRRITAWILLVGLIFGVTGCGHLSDTGISYIYADTDVSTLSEATIDKIVENVVNKNNLRDDRGRLLGFTALKKEIGKFGYKIEQKRTRQGNRYRCVQNEDN